MQIIIPMSGFGERFRRAGYKVPKPLIEVEGKSIIEHVVDLYPGDHDFIFICNEEHLYTVEYRMREILRRCAPNGRIVGIAPHKLGPVNAVLQAREQIDPDAPTIVNYCDFTCYWDFGEFQQFVEDADCDGAIPAYNGFHPHSLGSTFYAYLQHDGLWASNIQEKKPFTDNPMSEYASTGTYYFRTGALCVDAFERQMAREDLMVNGEFYASLAYRILFEDQRRVAIYPVQHFMQWGTPADLEQYVGWSNAFRRLSMNTRTRAYHHGSVLIPMAGMGSRFTQAGYELPKPLIEVSGRPMAIQATRDLPDAPVHRFILRKDLPGLDPIIRKLKTSFTCAETVMLDGLTEGQAITCQLGMDGLDLAAPLTIGACDNGVLYDNASLNDALDEEDVDLLVWTVRGHADGRARPDMFGWVDADENGEVSGVSVKAPLDAPDTDPMIVGTFTFRRAGDFLRAVERLVERDGRVNNEFYVDSLIEDCVELGLNVRVFEVDAYIGWGTPDDLKTFEYWQSCFHKWGSHPYRLEKDQRVPVAKVDELTERYAHQAPPLPEGVQKRKASPGLSPPRPGVFDAPDWRQLAWFGVVGLATVAIDFSAYAGLLHVESPPWLAKAIAFLLGAMFAYLANAKLTFRSKRIGATTFGLVLAGYAISMGLNVSTNSIGLFILGDWDMAIPLAFLAALGVSAPVNFLIMRRVLG